jgi:hypothetical protein
VNHPPVPPPQYTVRSQPIGLSRSNSLSDIAPTISGGLTRRLSVSSLSSEDEQEEEATTASSLKPVNRPLLKHRSESLPSFPPRQLVSNTQDTRQTADEEELAKLPVRSSSRNLSHERMPTDLCPLRSVEPENVAPFSLGAVPLERPLTSPRSRRRHHRFHSQLSPFWSNLPPSQTCRPRRTRSQRQVEGSSTRSRGQAEEGISRRQNLLGIRGREAERRRRGETIKRRRRKVGFSFFDRQVVSNFLHSPYIASSPSFSRSRRICFRRRIVERGMETIVEEAQPRCKSGQRIGENVRDGHRNFGTLDQRFSRWFACQESDRLGEEEQQDLVATY